MKSEVVIKGAGIDQTIVDGDGNGIFYGYSADRYILEGFTITNASNFLQDGINCWSSNSIISNNKICNCSRAIAVSDNAIIKNNIIVDNSYRGLFCGSVSSPQIINNLIVNSNDAITGVGCDFIVERNTIDNNNYGGVYMQIADSNPQLEVTVTNNIITNNNGSWGGVSLNGVTDQTNIVITYNDVWNNSSNYSGWSADPSDISQDPQFVHSGMVLSMATRSLSQIADFDIEEEFNRNIIEKELLDAHEAAYLETGIKKSNTRTLIAIADVPDRELMASTETDPAGYHLQESSPCIDAGDPASALDPDGTTADMGAYYFDQITDNTPPFIPQNLTAVPDDEQVTLRWSRNSDTGIHKYNIYQGTSSPASTLIDSVVAASPPDTFFVDTGLTNGQAYFYRITAVDSFKNESGFSDEVSATPVPSVLVQINVWLEGPYSTSGDSMTTALNTSAHIPLQSPYVDSLEVSGIPAGVTDWVLLQLRDAADGDALSQRSFFLKNNSDVVDTNGTSTDIKLPGVADGNYFIVVRHRNHLAVISATAQSLNNSSALSHDFTDNSDKYYGGINGVKELETGVWGMIAGDANGNGEVQVDDNSDYWWLQVGTAGYKSGDFNVNGEVQIDDQADYWWQNVGRGSQVP
ncbi:right-handed parallel beta-helix repeat-containing protein [bacterium]